MIYSSHCKSKSCWIHTNDIYLEPVNVIYFGRCLSSKTRSIFSNQKHGSFGFQVYAYKTSQADTVNKTTPSFVEDIDLLLSYLPKLSWVWNWDPCKYIYIYIYIWAMYYKSLTWMFRPCWVGFPYFSLPFGETSEVLVAINCLERCEQWPVDPCFLLYMGDEKLPCCICL